MIFTVFGIKIKIEFMFTATVAFLALIDTQSVMWMSFVAVAVHELGHIVAMIILHMKIRQIRLSCCGVLIDGDDCVSLIRGIIIASSGPIVNVLFSLAVSDSEFACIMLSTGVFNLIPVIGTDGGDILRLTCMCIFGSNGYQIAFAVISFVFSTVMLVGGIMLIIAYHNPTLLASAVYFVTMTIASLITV